MLFLYITASSDNYIPFSNEDILLKTEDDSDDGTMSEFSLESTKSILPYDPDAFHPDYWHETKHNFPQENDITQQAMFSLAQEKQDWDFIQDYYPSMTSEVAHMIVSLLINNGQQCLVDEILEHFTNDWQLRDQYFDDTSPATQRRLCQAAFRRGKKDFLREHDPASHPPSPQLKPKDLFKGSRKRNRN